MSDNNSSGFSDDDVFGMLWISPYLVPVITMTGLYWWKSAREWAMQYGLVADKHEAVIAVPGWDGAGLSGVHIVVASCAIIGLVVLAGSMARRRTRLHRGEQPEPPPFRSHL